MPGGLHDLILILIINTFHYPQMRKLHARGKAHCSMPRICLIPEHKPRPSCPWKGVPRAWKRCLKNHSGKGRGRLTFQGSQPTSPLLPEPRFFELFYSTCCLSCRKCINFPSFEQFPCPQKKLAVQFFYS